MRAFAVVFSPAAAHDLESMRDFIAKAAGRDIADRFVARLVVHCEGFARAPQRGTAAPYATTSERVCASRAGGGPLRSRLPWRRGGSISRGFSTAVGMLLARWRRGGSRCGDRALH